VRLAVATLLLLLLGRAAYAQPIDLSHGGPVNITARDGIEWHQNDQEVIAHGDARAVRGNVTITADTLIAYYRRKAGAGASTTTPPPPPRPAATGPDETGNNEIYRLEAVGNVHIYTRTDEAVGDRAIYDIDQAVMVMTGKDLKLTTPQDIITARDDLEYWSDKHMAVGRGDAVVTSNDQRQISADTIVAYMKPPDQQQSQQQQQQQAAKPARPPGGQQDDDLAASGKLQRVEAFGNVVIRTTTQVVRGDRGVYVPDTGMARMAGKTRLTQGQNQVNGSGLEVNLNTGIYTLVSSPGDRVQGVVVPNDANAASGDAAAPPPAAKAKPQSATGTPK
jgi:lipopolysaccharide export system protein LptA